jgi:hypothetical protein
LRWICCAVTIVVTTTACGSRSESPLIERAFTVDWHDRANAVDVRYAVTSIRFHDGRWSARISVANRSGKPLYETAWAADLSHIRWDGPAIVFAGLDVLGNRRLIYFPADREEPAIPLPLRPGATWHGTVSGKLPDAPPLPRGKQIWVRYPEFGIGQVWDGLNPALAVQWISDRSVTL